MFYWVAGVALVRKFASGIRSPKHASVATALLGRLIASPLA